jgi:hypothetical protein
MSWMIILLEQGSMTGMLTLNEAMTAGEAWTAAKQLAAEFTCETSIVMRESGRPESHGSFVEVRMCTDSCDSYSMN